MPDESSGAATSATEAEACFPVFALAWAAAILFHQAHSGRWLATPLDVVLDIAAGLVLLAPARPQLLLILAAAQCLSAVVELPFLFAHWILCAVGSLAMLVTLPGARRPGGTGLDAGSWFLGFAPLLRIELLLAYFWAVFHKLNRGFFDPEQGCTAHFLHALARGPLPFLPATGPVPAAVPLVVIAIEAAIPILLVAARTGPLGVLVGASFHLVLGFAYHYDFSALIFAFYVLFLPASQVASLWRGLASSDRLRRGARVLSALAVAMALLALLWSGRQWRPPTYHGRSHELAGAAWWLHGAVLLSVFALVAARGRPREPAARLFRPPARWTLLVPALLLPIGASPYLGLGTENALSMFSNLRTEGGASNHLLVPASWQVFDHQRQLVVVREASLEVAGREIAGPFVVPALELRCSVSAGVARGMRNIHLVLEDADGRVREIENAERVPELAEPPAALACKLLRFRPLPVKRPGACLH